MQRTVLLLLGFLLLAVSSFAQEERVTFHDHQVFRFSIRNETERDQVLYVVRKHNLDLWAATPEWIDVRVSPDERQHLQGLLVPYQLMIENLQVLLDEEAQHIQAHAADPFFTTYRTLDEFTKFFNDLAAKYPQLVTKQVIGTSVERRQITGIKITSSKNPGKPGIVYNGGQHAREWISPMTNAWIANELLTRYGTDATITRLVDELEWSIIPIVNPDGYVYTWAPNGNRMWRKNRRFYNNPQNCVGVDNNRNWDFHWGEAGASANPCADDFRGPSAFSEPEEKALTDYISAQGNVKGYIDFHAYSQLWMNPWGWTSARPTDYAIQMAAAKACVDALTRVHGTQYKYGPISTTIYPASGSSVDWVYGVTNVTVSFAVEGRDTGRYGFALPANQIVPSGEENMAAVIAMGNFILSRADEL